MTADPPPILLACCASGFESAIVRLRDQGWTIQDGFAVQDEPWDLTPMRIACVGAMETAQEAAQAILAVARGAALLIPDSDSVGPYLDDLMRVGVVDWVERDSTDASSPGPAQRLDPDQERLLGLLARGVAVAEAAHACHLSVRTAQRRLSDARLRLGVSSNRAAVVALAQRSQQAKAQSAPTIE